MSLATNPSRQNRSLCEHKKTTVVNGIFKVRQGRPLYSKHEGESYVENGGGEKFGKSSERRS